MTFHMILGLGFEDYGIAINETIQTTHDGSEVLAKYPRELVIK